jgi:hypothetical protein
MAVFGAQKHKPAAAEIAGGGMNDSQRKAGSHGRVDGIAPAAQHLNTGVGGQMVDADDHAMPGSDRLFVEIGNHVRTALLDWALGSNLALRGDRDWERSAREGSQDGKTGPSNHGVLTG